VEQRGPRVPCHGGAWARKDQFQGCRRAVIGQAEQPESRGEWVTQMSKDELIIQLIKVALGILIAGYFLWWSLEVLKRLPPPL
jgi:hypothetical protein